MLVHFEPKSFKSTHFILSFTYMYSVVIGTQERKREGGGGGGGAVLVYGLKERNGKKCMYMYNLISQHLHV